MKKPLKTAAWCGLISLILTSIVLPLTFILEKNFLINLVLFVVSLTGGVLSIFFTYGFVVLGRRFNNKLLLVISWIGIGIGIAALLFGVFFNLISLVHLVDAQEEFNEPTAVQDIYGMMMGIILFFIFVIIVIFFGTYTILFGVGILKLKEKLKYAKAAGILDIVAGATYIILVGFLVRIIAFVFEIVLLFEAAKKFER